jgi:arylsulfatase A-like enzyme
VSRGLALALAAAAFVQAPAPTPVSTPSPTPPSDPRPNIVLLLVDDMDSASLEHMPILQAQLLARGASFSSYIASDPLCAPSRASILTGRYAHNHGLFENKPPAGGYREFAESKGEAATVAVGLRAAGYRTALVGKYLNRYPTKGRQKHVPPGWDDWHALFFPETYWNYRMNENGRTVPYGDRDDEYQTDVLAARAVQFVKNGDGPFFLYLAPFAPHAPASPATRHEERFPGLKAPRTPSFDEEDVSDKPARVRARPRLSANALREIDDWHRRRAQTLQAVDEMLGRLLDTLKEKVTLENTYVFFSSDNGYQLGAHRLRSDKGDPYEESIRVPLIVRGPGVAPGSTIAPLAVNVDLMPTFLALAGAPLAPSLDGRSLLPLLRGAPPEDWRRDALVEHWENRGSGPEYVALRSENEIYVEYPASREVELYDLALDPYELKSLHNSADPARLKLLAARLAALRDCRGETCR